MRIISFFFLIFVISSTQLLADESIEFNKWKKNFKILALKNNISEKTFDTVMANVKFLSNVIKYDRYQPEFYEDTKTYITKRTSAKKVQKGSSFYSKNLTLINDVEKKIQYRKRITSFINGY